jgi:hypothetical protein
MNQELDTIDLHNGAECTPGFYANIGRGEHGVNQYVRDQPLAMVPNEGE